MLGPFFRREALGDSVIYGRQTVAVYPHDLFPVQPPDRGRFEPMARRTLGISFGALTIVTAQNIPFSADLL